MSDLIEKVANNLKPFSSKTLIGETCAICGNPAFAKVGEEIPSDDPNQHRHNLTAYVCEGHFELIFNKTQRDYVGRIKKS